MNYRELGTTGVKVSELSLGCWTLGGLNWADGQPNGWANVDEAECIRAIRLALDRGVNHFDNADVYGNGRAERMLAKGLGSDSGNVVVATKVGHFPGTAGHAYEPLHIRHQCEQSLVNLKRDFIDVYYFHHGNFGENDRYLDDAVEMAYRLKDEGKIRVIGLSAYSNEDFLRLVPRIQPQVLQSWANMHDNHYIAEGHPVRKLMDERKISFVAFGPLKKGLMLGKYSPKNPPKFEPGDHRASSQSFSMEELAKIEPKIEKMKARFGARTEDLSRAALQYLFAQPCVACVIPGFRNSAQVEMNLSAEGKPLTRADVNYINEIWRI